MIEPGERAMIAGVMRLGDRPVRAVMTPRRDVDMIDLSADPARIRRIILDSGHSRLPVHEGTPEEMLGVVHARDLLDAYLRDEPPGVRARDICAEDVRARVQPAPTCLTLPMRSTSWTSSRDQRSIWGSSTTSTVTFKE